MRRFAWWLLRKVEEIFLVAHGWKKTGHDSWQRPVDYEWGDGGDNGYRTGHAVNSQKWACRHEQIAEQQRRWKETHQ